MQVEEKIEEGSKVEEVPTEEKQVEVNSEFLFPKLSRKERRAMKKRGETENPQIKQMKEFLKTIKEFKNNDIDLEEKEEELSEEEKIERTNQFNETLFTFFKTLDEKELVRENAYIADIKKTDPNLGIYKVKQKRLNQFRISFQRLSDVILNAFKKTDLVLGIEDEPILIPTKYFSSLETQFSEFKQTYKIFCERLKNYKYAKFYHPEVLNYAINLFDQDDKFRTVKAEILKRVVIVYLANIKIEENEELMTRVLINFKYLKFFSEDCKSNFINNFALQCKETLDKFVALIVETLSVCNKEELESDGIIANTEGIYGQFEKIFNEEQGKSNNKLSGESDSLSP